jgi:outer membrane protein assembly factor BamB
MTRERRIRRRLIATAACGVAMLVAGCTSGAEHAGRGGGQPVPATTASGSGTSTPPRPGDWPTYHRDGARSGAASRFPAPRKLRVAWRRKLDGAVYGQPLVVGEDVLAATEGDTVYALDRGTGTIRWKRHLGSPVPVSKLPCGNIDPLGITGTMVYDPATSRVFAVAETTGARHVLYGLDAKTGKVVVRREVEPPKGNRRAHQQRAALALAGGRVFVAYGGLFGDCADYIGSVVSVRTDGTGMQSYAIPTEREAGIWAPAGPVLDGRRILVADGNGASTTRYDGSDSVLALSVRGLRKLDLFAPKVWRRDNAHDKDLGTSSPVPVGDYVLATGKRGVTYVLRRRHFGGVGGQVAKLATCPSFGGAAVVDHTAYLPCIHGGTAAVHVSPAGTPTLRWRAESPAKGSPTVGGGAVWVVAYDSGVLDAFDRQTGRRIASTRIGTAPHFASPTLAGGHAYVGTLHGVVAVAAGH